VFLQSRLLLKGYKVKWHEYLVSCLCVIGILSLSAIALYQVVGLLTIAIIYALSSLKETHRV
jgi:type III secretory pathway component EscS